MEKDGKGGCQAGSRARHYGDGGHDSLRRVQSRGMGDRRERVEARVRGDFWVLGSIGHVDAGAIS